MYRKISTIVIPTLIAAGILGYMIFSIWDDLLIAIQHIIPLYLVVAVAICLSAWWLRGWRYHTILRGLDYDIGITVSTACIFVSQTVNLIVPARLGDFVRVFILKHEFNTTYSEGVSSLVVERVFDIFTVALLGAVSLVFVLNAPAWFSTLIVVPLAAGLLFFAFLLCIGKFSSENKYIHIILTMLDEIKRASLSIRSVTVLGTSSIIIWLLDILVCYAVVCMFELQVPFALVVLAVVIGNLVKAVPLTPGGMGSPQWKHCVVVGMGSGYRRRRRQPDGVRGIPEISPEAPAPLGRRDLDIPVPGRERPGAAGVGPVGEPQRDHPVVLRARRMRKHHHQRVRRLSARDGQLDPDRPGSGVDGQRGGGAERRSGCVASRVSVDRQSFLAEVVAHHDVARPDRDGERDEAGDDHRERQADDEPHQRDAVPARSAVEPASAHDAAAVAVVRPHVLRAPGSAPAHIAAAVRRVRAGVAPGNQPSDLGRSFGRVLLDGGFEFIEAFRPLGDEVLLRPAILENDMH